MDLSIVIVNWKVKPLLKKCLESIYRETRGISFEVFVVDNDSRDGSVEMVRDEFPQVQLTANSRNLGFAAGNNLAIASSAGDFVVLLNPDTELTGDALSKMVAFMRRSPFVGVCGPRLVNADGSIQPSVRRFPTLISQALIMLKLHHLLPGLRSLRYYFAADFNYEQAARVDQVMGAVFMIRRSVLEAIGALDERFFIWFEEVDFCKRAADAGFQIWYAPEARVLHHGNESFAQVFGPRKQNIFNRSLRAYFFKHFGLPPYAVLLALQPFSAALAWAARFLPPIRSILEISGGFRSAFRLSLLSLVFFEAISFVGFLSPIFSSVVFAAICILAAVLAAVRIDLAMLLVLADLFAGSQGGAMLSFAVYGADISLRMGLFLSVFGVWAARQIIGVIDKNKGRGGSAFDWIGRLRASRIFWPYCAFLAVVVFGAVRGLALGNNFGNVFFDANGYAYYLLFPIFVAASAERRALERGIAVLFAAVMAAVVKALLVLFIFSHQMLAAAPYVYSWVRDTRVGEITRLAGDFYRVFFQSHLYALLAAFCLLPFILSVRSWTARRSRLAIGIFLWSLIGIVLSFSRSFWFGAAGASLGAIALLVRGRVSRGVWYRALVLGLVGPIAAVAIITGVYVFPFPPKSGQSILLVGLFGERAASTSDDAAAQSRWALLPELWRAGAKRPLLGSGLGSTVTYTTSDPRLRSSNPTGQYTTYAFEWGYHDLWLKFGLVGLAVYAWLIAAIMAPLRRAAQAGRDLFSGAGAGADGSKKDKPAVAAGLLLGLVALLMTNVFSPYLNHPLGIGFIMIVGALAANYFFSLRSSEFSNMAPTKSG